jgi:hypothetical protein
MPLDSPDLESTDNRARMRRTYAVVVIVQVAVLASLWWLQTTFS